MRKLERATAFFPRKRESKSVEDIRFTVVSPLLQILLGMRFEKGKHRKEIDMEK